MDWAFLKHAAALKHVAAHVLFAAILVAILPVALQAETANDIASLNRQIFQLYGQGKYAEAAALAREALSLTEQVLGKEHPDTLTSVNTLALLYKAEGRLAEAEPLRPICFAPGFRDGPATRSVWIAMVFLDRTAVTP